MGVHFLSAAIEYPYGRPMGQVGDREGQRNVLLKTLEVLEKAKKPGEVWHLPFTWPEEPKKTDWQPTRDVTVNQVLFGGYKESQR